MSRHYHLKENILPNFFTNLFVWTNVLVMQSHQYGLTNKEVLMRKLISVVLVSATFLFSVSPMVMANSVTDKAKTMQMKMQKINLNTATVEELSVLPGVGEKKAAAIIDYRKMKGKFTSIDELVEVKGIGPKMLEKMKDQISL